MNLLVSILFFVTVAANSLEKNLPEQLTLNDKNSSITNYLDSSENDIAFDLPDLTATIETPEGGEFQIEAYKSVNNDRLLQPTLPGSKDPSRTSELFWVSVGQPAFVKTVALDSITQQTPTKRLFHFSTMGFYSYLQMLTPSHRALLAAAASAKFRVNILDNQIVNLVLSKFECSLFVYDDAGSKYLITGSVSDFRNFPLRIDFNAPRNSIERKLFADLLKDADGKDEQINDMHFTCQLASKGKLMKTNTLTISLQQQQQIGLVDKLFGPTNADETDVQSVYVTRNQMTELAAEMYSTLNIIEDYQMPESQFSEAFVDSLVSQVSVNHFSMVSLEGAVNALSTYGFDFSEDLRPDHVTRDMGSILRIEKLNNKSRIIVDESKVSELEQSNSGQFGVGVKVLGFEGSISWAQGNARHSVEETGSLNDQLNELNMLSQEDVKWAIEGDRVIPKSLNVVRLGRSLFSKTLMFQRIRLQEFSAAFDRTFGLYTIRAAVIAPAIDRLEKRLNATQEDLKNGLGVLRNEIEVSKAAQSSLVTATKASLIKSIDSSTASIQARINQLDKFTRDVQNSVTALSSKALRRCKVCHFVDCGGGKQSLYCTNWSMNDMTSSVGYQPGTCWRSMRIECRVD